MTFLTLVLHFLLINGCSSFEFSKLLLSHSTDTAGTICADRKNLPVEVKKKKGKKKKKKKKERKKGKQLFYMNKEQILWLHSGEIKKMFP